MAESEFQERNYDERRKRKENSEKDLEEVLEKMEELTVHVALIAYDWTALRTNPDLSNAMQHLEVVFVRCKKEMEKKCQEELME
ncbi:SYCE3 protein, partial [Mystacornis crossleyi]|nr:SYCE3 protein [Mystacornis crossleyi]